MIKISNMRKLFTTLICVFISAISFGANLNGTYISTDIMNINNEDIKVAYTFTGDSLYIDTYDSGCGIACISLEKINDIDFNAIETIIDIYDTKATIKKYKMSFIPCIFENNCYAVCCNDEVIDIIKKVE